MIGLLVDAAIAVVVVLDRVCSAVEKAARPPSPAGVGAPPAGTGAASASSPSSGGHLNHLRQEPLVWGEHAHN